MARRKAEQYIWCNSVKDEKNIVAHYPWNSHSNDWQNPMVSELVWWSFLFYFFEPIWLWYERRYQNRLRRSLFVSLLITRPAFENFSMGLSEINPARLIFISFVWVTSLLDCGKATDKNYHDFSKYWLKVPHDILVCKSVKWVKMIVTSGGFTADWNTVLRVLIKVVLVNWREIFSGMPPVADIFQYFNQWLR